MSQYLGWLKSESIDIFAVRAYVKLMKTWIQISHILKISGIFSGRV